MTSGRDIPEEYLSGYARILTTAAATGRRPGREELDARRALGEKAAEDGYALRTLIGAHLATTRRALAGRITPDHVMAAMEQAVDAFAEGHERAQRLAVRQEEAARREFIDDLLLGRSHLGRLSERAARFGLHLAHAHAVAVARGPESYEDTGAAARQVELALTARFGSRTFLLATKDGQLICVAPGDHDELLACFAKQAYEAASARGLVAVGRPHPGAGGVVTSYEEALGALDLADRLGFDGPVLRAADLLVFPVLTRDRAAMADLVLSVLGPLRAGRGGAVPLLDTLTAYFDAGCVSAEAARRLSLSVRALTYRLERIHRLTGTDPGDPVQRYTLQTAVIGARLLDWPQRPL
ncbi:helix-turn-helix domain-containing protein [Streptomyces sp. NBC_00249]|uniref:PucR family transcriptional regulator n=1 Tax=Streptomyces sp. NBC_00249 TaxID=2975690 RepID=UPI00225175CC|nr:helix-turn-helix domain-containing protein [Streptomyces sp. NBC_00249]MCX5196128.1 helix-turn-helix domain-containing protein [Streptomyces sp. NBC_00249]